MLLSIHFQLRQSAFDPLVELEEIGMLTESRAVDGSIYKSLLSDQEILLECL